MGKHTINPRRKIISFRITEDDFQYLQNLSDQTNKSVSEIISEAIPFLKRHFVRIYEKKMIISAQRSTPASAYCVSAQISHVLPSTLNND